MPSVIARSALDQAVTLYVTMRTASSPGLCFCGGGAGARRCVPLVTPWRPRTPRRVTRWTGRRGQRSRRPVDLHRTSSSSSRTGETSVVGVFVGDKRERLSRDRDLGCVSSMGVDLRPMRVAALLLDAGSSGVRPTPAPVSSEDRTLCAAPMPLAPFPPFVTGASGIGLLPRPRAPVITFCSSTATLGPLGTTGGCV